MKKLLIYICLLMPLVAFQACKKAASPGDNYDFSNPLPPYVAFKTTNKATAPDTVKLADDLITAGTYKVAFINRTAIQQDITVTYSVSGAITLANQTVKILRNATTTADVIITVPANTAEGTFIVSLDKAVAADGTVFALGANNVVAQQKVYVAIEQL